ncbi:hypothetical protein COX03_01200 [Candidatus Woesebacteria bacterium CG22_combo_CG10-13_8_21_14_all_39_10]|uniref:Radical SAM core domain-containing protein n=2 Tax=Candidatus Woeseibacteriota TaxID=1752722 RepID=A0A2H0BJB4_9BACT|nr:MAG: hypothetical protein COX03_01200 [Candidatus Woesebacteria bacterium CG22_combo_CG10-13_8_21_14_all_39_10]PIZ50315.1 MAG: hypothetical protein COY29_00065 [Candidatus Woesebacteria bacterium CG_4_10_14_0_2_um_filter_39_14]
MKKPTIKQLWIEPSGFCNINCTMCGGNVRQKQFTKRTGLMSFNFFKKIVDEFTEFSNKSLLRVDFRGTGEPLLNKNIIKMVSYCSGNSLLVGITTNGLLLDKKTSRDLINNDLTTLTLSIESVNKYIYEAIRKGSNIDIVKNNIANFCDIIRTLNSACKIQFNVVLSEKTIGEIEEIINFAGKISIDNISLLNIEASDENGNDEIYSNDKIHGKSRHEMLDLFHKWTRLAGKSSVRINLPPSAANKDKNCIFNWSAPMITCDGLVFPCCRMQNIKYTLGDLKKQSLSEIWQSNAYQNFRLGNHKYCGFCLKYLDRFENMYWLNRS